MGRPKHTSKAFDENDYIDSDVTNKICSEIDDTAKYLLEQYDIHNDALLMNDIEMYAQYILNRDFSNAEVFMGMIKSRLERRMVYVHDSIMGYRDMYMKQIVDMKDNLFLLRNRYKIKDFVKDMDLYKNICHRRANGMIYEFKYRVKKHCSKYGIPCIEWEKTNPINEKELQNEINMR